MRDNLVAVGSIAGTGATLRVPLGFIPRYVKVFNPNDAGAFFPTLEWWQGMAAASALKFNSATYCLASPGLVIGSSSAAKVKIANTVNYLVNGVFCTKTTAEVAFTATSHDIAANASYVQEAVYLLSLQAGGTATLTMGAIATGAGNAVIPATPANEAAIGYVRIAVAAGATPFDASTDLLSAGHLTVTYTNIFTLGFPAQLISNLGISEYAGASPNTRLTGTVTMTLASKTLTGSSTLFLTELKVGDLVLIAGQTFTVASIASNTSATMVEAASPAIAALSLAVRKNGREAGFTIGADLDINVSGETVYYHAIG